MSSPGRRIQTDVMKLYYFLPFSLLLIHHRPHRIMSQYDVQLINENMHEFYIKFEGPSESTYSATPYIPLLNSHSPLQRRCLESSR